MLHASLSCILARTQQGRCQSSVPEVYFLQVEGQCKMVAVLERAAMLEEMRFDLYLERKNATIDEMISDPI